MEEHCPVPRFNDHVDCDLVFIHVILTLYYSDLIKMSLTYLYT